MRMESPPRLCHAGTMVNLATAADKCLGPRTSMWLRAQKNRRRLFGLHAPASLLQSFVMQGRPAVDVGAAAGLYTYFMAARASWVHAFEPNPAQYRRLAASAPTNVTTYDVALSDRESVSALHIRESALGEASLRAPTREAATSSVQVTTRPLDAYQLAEVGFVKIDVEGHEEAVLLGAAETIRTFRPNVFIELEERHNPGTVGRVIRWFDDIGYQNANFLYKGSLRPVESLHKERDAVDPSSSRYVNNFLFCAQT